MKRPDGSYKRSVAIVDTGAQVSLLPDDIMSDLDYRVIGTGIIEVEQAGIAKQTFKAVEAAIKLKFEDQFGNETADLEIPIWFADAKYPLIGFEGVLDRAVLHLDMAGAREGYLEI
jgi:hypothetical protein